MNIKEALQWFVEQNGAGLVQKLDTNEDYTYDEFIMTFGESNLMFNPVKHRLFRFKVVNPIKFEFKFTGACACSEYREKVKLYIPSKLNGIERRNFIQKKYEEWIDETFNCEITELKQ